MKGSAPLPARKIVPPTIAPLKVGRLRKAQIDERLAGPERMQDVTRQKGGTRDQHEDENTWRDEVRSCKRDARQSERKTRTQQQEALRVEVATASATNVGDEGAGEHEADGRDGMLIQKIQRQSNAW